MFSHPNLFHGCAVSNLRLKSKCCLPRQHCGPQLGPGLVLDTGNSLLQMHKLLKGAFLEHILSLGPSVPLLPQYLPAAVFLRRLKGQALSVLPLFGTLDLLLLDLGPEIKEVRDNDTMPTGLVSTNLLVVLCVVMATSDVMANPTQSNALV